MAAAGFSRGSPANSSISSASLHKVGVGWHASVWRDREVKGGANRGKAKLAYTQIKEGKKKNGETEKDKVAHAWRTAL